MKRIAGTLRRIAPFLLLALASTLILYAPFVLRGRALYWGTAMWQFWPWRLFAAGELHTGRLPLWNPYAGNGVPLLADHQTALFYPLNLIFWLLPVERAMGYSLALHALLAAVTMYALARDLGIRRLGSAVAGIAFAFSGYMVARGSFLTEVAALPWLPLIWLFGRRLVWRRRLRDLAWLSLVIAIQFLAGHAQTWFYSLISLGLYGGWEAWRASRARETAGGHGTKHARPRRWATATALLGGAVVWGIGLAAVQFVPTAELSRDAVRVESAGWEAYALQYSFWPWRLLTLAMPSFFGSPAHDDYWGYATYWEDAGYVGVLPLAFALYALVAWFRRSRRGDLQPRTLGAVPQFAALSAFALLMALGKNTPFYLFFFHHVPGFGAFQAPARWLCVLTPALALLGGIGIDALRPSGQLRFICHLAAAGAGSIALTALAAQYMLVGVRATFFLPLVQFGLLLAATMLLCLWGQAVRTESAGPVGRTAWQVATVILVVADLLWAGWGLNPAIDSALYEGQALSARFLQNEGPLGRTFYFSETLYELTWGHLIDLSGYGPNDLARWRSVREVLVPDLSTAEKVPSANSDEPLLPGRYEALLEAVESMPEEAAWRTLGLMNVAYVLDPASRDDRQVAYRALPVNVYRNPYVLPRAYVVCAAQGADSPDEALHMLSAPSFDPEQEVILEGVEETRVRPCGLQPATLLPSPPNQATIRAVLPEPGYLVLADTAYPGWEAYVDGRRVEILMANVAFRALDLEAGEHEVRFVYRPRSFSIGVVVSSLALSMLGIALFLRRVRKGVRIVPH
ncbi:MAG: YfhO family protein [Anaerolineae bacterium]